MPAWLLQPTKNINSGLHFDSAVRPEYISKIVKQLADTFPGVKQVRHLGLENASELEILEFAIINGYAVVTFDSDFVDLNILKGFPPKIIWLKTGNLTTRSIAELFNKNVVTIRNFLHAEEAQILELIR